MGVFALIYSSFIPIIQIHLVELDKNQMLFSSVVDLVLS